MYWNIATYEHFQQANITVLHALVVCYWNNNTSVIGYYSVPMELK